MVEENGTIVCGQDHLVMPKRENAEFDAYAKITVMM